MQAFSPDLDALWMETLESLRADGVDVEAWLARGAEVVAAWRERPWPDVPPERKS